LANGVYHIEDEAEEEEEVEEEEVDDVLFDIE
jgi:hypothetical protein